MTTPFKTTLYTSLKTLHETMASLQKVIHLLEKEEDVRNQILAELGRLAGSPSQPSPRNGNSKKVKTSRKLKPWMETAFELLGKETKLEVLVSKLRDLGHDISDKTVHSFLRRQVELRTISKVATGRYLVIPKEKPARKRRSSK